MKKLAGLLLILSMLIPMLPALADSPTPTPTPVMFARTDLLAQLHVKTYTILPFDLQWGAKIPDIIGQSGSWYLTFQDIFAQTGAFGYLIGGMILLFIVFLVLRLLARFTGNTFTRWQRGHPELTQSEAERQLGMGGELRSMDYYLSSKGQSDLRRLNSDRVGQVQNTTNKIRGDYKIFKTLRSDLPRKSKSRRRSRS